MGKSTGSADVYAGDIADSDRSADSSLVVYLFAILADGQPDAFSRIAGSFNLANVAPLSVDLRRTGTGHIQVTVEMSHIPATTADSIRRKLAQLTCVNQVELSSLMLTPNGIGPSNA
jgi:hypothetical protein